jgi:UPF0755 protein
MVLKKFLVIPILLFIFLVSFALGILIWWRDASKPISSEATKVRFVIPRGRSVTQVANSLYEEKLIKSSLAFKFYVQLTGKTNKVQAGEFQLSANLTIPQIVDELSKGPREVWVTIPEGLRREEIVFRFIEGLEIKKEGQELFLEEFMRETESKEGFLFPDTYLFPPDASASAVVKVLTQTFDRKISGDLRIKIDKNQYSLNELVTMASIIERETITDEERPVVAGVLFNRLAEGMPLQADATVQYIIGSKRCGNGNNIKSKDGKCDWWSPPTISELEVVSPYNTYKVSGLPPFPIANPGLSSLKAAIDPAETDYYYYIHDPNGEIHFAKTLDEHNANVRNYLRK